MAMQIYKNGQGNLARTVTAVGLGAIAGFGCIKLNAFLTAFEMSRWSLGGMRLDPAAVLSVALFLLCAAGIAWFVLVWQYLVDYLILTEAELRKVAWPTRRDLIQQTIVVIAVSASLGMMILLVDLVFSNFFTTVGVL